MRMWVETGQHTAAQALELVFPKIYGTFLMPKGSSLCSSSKTLVRTSSCTALVGGNRAAYSSSAAADTEWGRPPVHMGGGQHFALLVTDS